MSRAVSIKTRLFVFSIIFCLVGLILIGGYSYIIARRALLDRTYNQLTAIREEKAIRVKHFFRDRLRDVEMISSASEVQSFAKDFGGNYPLDYDFYMQTSSFSSLLSFLKNAESYCSFSVLLPGGHMFCSELNKKNGADPYVSTSYGKKVPFQSIYNQAIQEGKAIAFDFVKNPVSNINSAFVASPIITNSLDTLGVALLEIPELAMNNIMAERLDEIALGKTGEVYLAGSDFLMRSSSRFLKNSVLTVECKTYPVEQSLMGNAGTSKVIDYRGEKVLSSFSPLDLPHTNWVIVAEIDWDEALHDVNKLKYRIIIIGLIVFILLSIGVLLFSWKITNPLYELKKAALRISDGKFDRLLPIEQRDEIGLLTQVFNKMTLRLKHTTQRLVEREERLLHFYRATVDGIMLHNSGKPILVNRALVSLTKYSEKELLNNSARDLFADNEFLLFNQKHDDVHSFESVLLTKDSDEIPVEVQQRNIIYHDQEVEALVIRNISERKRIENELRSERQHRLRSVIDGQEQERQRLSRELHDGLGQLLVAIKLRLESISLDKLGEERKTIETVKNLFSQTIEDTRRMSNNLMPAALTEFSLAVVLRNLCNEMEANSSITVSLVTGVLPDSLDMLTKTYAYRIVQEALNNVVKHSNANRAVVSIFSDILKFYIHIEDDGAGFDTRKNVEMGNGLYNMRERSVILNGKFEFESSPGDGTIIRVELPVKK